MKLRILLVFIILFFAQACKKSDIGINAPEFSDQTTLKRFDHTNFEDKNCIDCHESKRPISIPRHGDGINCIECHIAKKDNSGIRTWKNLKKFTHANNPVTCNQCHSTPLMDSRPVPKENHPTQKYNKLDCVVCHQFKSPLNNWKDITFNQKDHLPAPKTCIQCHEITRPESHIKNPSTDGMKSADCFACHGSFTNWKEQIKKFDHNNAAPKTCIECHKNDAPKPIENHPSLKESFTKLECNLCHTYNLNPNGQKKWTTITFNHKTHLPATSSCLSCHRDNNNSLPKNGSHNLASRKKLDCLECHKFENGFGWKKFTTFNHQKIESSETCESCHTSGTVLKYKTSAHVETKLSCVECHNTNGWKPAKFFHADSDTNCLKCHNGSMAHGLSINHIPTKNQCSNCHSNETFKPVIKASHLNEDLTNCTLCHSGQTSAKGKSDVHVVTSQECSVCHQNNAWKPATFFHVEANTNCTNCHNSKLAKGISNNHVPTQNECSTCHTNPIGMTAVNQNNLKFSPALKNTHKVENVVTNSNCSTCHNGKTTAAPKNTNHVETNLECAICHTLNAWKPAGFVHVTSDNNCSSCHDGKKALGLSSNHIPSTVQCSNCHTNPIGMDASEQKTLKFKPTLKKTHIAESVTNKSTCNTCHDIKTTATPKNINHVNTALDCAICHSLNAWKPANYIHVKEDTSCTNCHNSKLAKGLSSNHIPTNMQCSSCHVTPIGLSSNEQLSLKFKPALKNTHATEFINISSSCTQCHNGITTATPKNANHVSTTQNCALCHGLSQWKPATFFHDNSSTNCLACHDGKNNQNGIGKNPKHVPTTNQCSSCHVNPIGMTGVDQAKLKFTPALKNTHKVENVTMTTTCFTCHDGSTVAASKNAKHITTKQDCMICHSLNAWKPATYKHDVQDSQCLNCHNGTNASGKPISHILITNSQCSVCHSQTRWAPAVYNRSFTHSNNGSLPAINYRGTITYHKKINDCTSCHDQKTDRVNYPSPKFAPTCMGCHEQEFREGKFHRGNLNASVRNCLQCHTYSDWDRVNR